MLGRFFPPFLYGVPPEKTQGSSLRRPKARKRMKSLWFSVLFFFSSLFFFYFSLGHFVNHAATSGAFETFRPGICGLQAGQGVSLGRK